MSCKIYTEFYLQGNDDALNSVETAVNRQLHLVNGSWNSGIFFIKVDHELVNAENHPVKAFDILFKLHFVFNVEYAKQLKSFYDFIPECMTL